jgi:hypothetical protein
MARDRENHFPGEVHQPGCKGCGKKVQRQTEETDLPEISAARVYGMAFTTFSFCRISSEKISMI